MAGHGTEDVDGLLAFPVRTPDPPGLEIRINFGMFAGREATGAEVEELAGALLPEIGQVEIVAENRYEFAADSEVEVHQVRIPVPKSNLPVDDFLIGELAGRLVGIAERWARSCIAERHAEVSEP
jgi:hypothetical protein